MVIGEAARASGVSAKMVRYYESIGLVPTAVRTEGGYRTYGDREVETRRFIRRARDLGLSMDRIKLLVGLWHDRERPSREVKRIAQARPCCLDKGGGRSKPIPVRDQAMRTEIGRPNSNMRFRA